MIEIATGKPPWHDFSNAITIMLKIARTQEPPPVPENLSQEAKDFLFNCMQIDPKKRWTARRLLGHPFLDNQNQLKPGISPKRYHNFCIRQSIEQS
jgi:mitogen-activated protein kinase kinase kinase